MQGCKFCKKTKQALKAAGIQYDEVEISRQPGLLSTVKSMVGHTTVPQACTSLLNVLKLPALQHGQQIKEPPCLPQTCMPSTARRR